MDLEKKTVFNILIYSMASGIALEKWLDFPGLNGQTSLNFLGWTAYYVDPRIPNHHPPENFEDHILEIPISLWRVDTKEMCGVVSNDQKNAKTMQKSELQVSSPIIPDYLMVNSSVDHFPQFSVVKIT